MKKIGIFCSMFLLSQVGWASHIVGGSINMNLLSQSGNKLLYEISISLILDETTLNAGNSDTDIVVNMYSISQKLLVNTFILRPFGSRRSVVYKNAACAKQRNLKFSEAIYRTTFSFSSELYDDPQGYRLVWERCCRSSNLSNIDSRQGMVFYLLIPPLFKNGQPFINSSPSYLVPDGDYICSNKPFQLKFSAVDKDNDELRYSLDDPLAGYTNTSLFVNPPDVFRESYPIVAWFTGFNAQNAIPGKPALSINPKTGVLSVFALEVGVYVFSVKCEEFRDGVKIGETRRDFQLPVVDCPKQTPPKPLILNENNTEIIGDATICLGSPLIIKTNIDYAWAYQWQKNDENILNATSYNLQVSEPGKYAVIKSFADMCSNDTISKTINVVLKTVPKAIITASKTQFCEGDSVKLTSNSPQTAGNTWVFNRSAVGNTKQTMVRAGGKYNLAIRYEDGCVSKDSIDLIRNSNPTAKISSASAVVCDKDSTLLTANVGTNFKYDWYRNGVLMSNLKKSQIYPKLDGNYTVQITDGNTCKNLSEKWTLSYSRTDVLLDSISPICNGSKDILKLNGSPVGGIYAGIGVSQSSFDTKLLAAGSYKISYSFTNQDKCTNTATRIIAIDTEPKIVFKNEVIRIKRGEPVPLENFVTPQNVSYQWSPTQNLNNSTLAIPTASPTEDTRYSLLVTTSNGCQSQARMSVLIGNVPFVPDAFSPNEDGLNDKWIIPNATIFPSLIVKIFGRWGELIYHSDGYSNPWDGYYKGQKVLPGSYAYQISYYGDVSGVLKGVVTVLY